MKFSKEIMDFVHALRQYYGEGSTKNDYVEVAYPVIEIKKMFKERELSVKLIYDSIDKTFEIQSPTYQFFSKISHYDYNRPESRWTRDKDFLFSLIRNLKLCGLWELISNKDFLVVNSFNKRTDVKKLWKALKEIEEI